MSVQIHRCRFMDYERASVSSMAFNLPSPGPSTPPSQDLKVAVGRSNGDIEIWNPFRWYPELTIYGSRGRSIEDLCWTGRSGSFRLFSVGGSEAITEWDLSSGTPVDIIRSDAGVVWALSVSPDGERLAAATETGVIVIYDVSNSVAGSTEFVKRLPSADASLACIKWMSANEVVAGGFDGSLRVWDIQQGRIVSTMRVDKARRGLNDATIVWALEIMPRTGQLASGDSNGFVKIWDGKTLSLQQSFQAHEGDVLCLNTDYENNTLFSSGLDQKIVCSRITDVKLRRWTIMTSTVAHSHDIRSMAVHEARGVSLLVSGGLERTFVVSSIAQFGARMHRKITLSRFRPQCEVQPENNTILEWNEQTLQLWRLTNGRKRLAAKLRTSADDDYISSASFDPSFGLLAAASLYKVKFFLVDEQGVAPLNTLDVGAKLVKFVGPEKLVMITADDELILYDTGESRTFEFDEPKTLREVSARLPYSNSVSLIAVSNDKKLAVAKNNRYIEIYDAETLKHVGGLPAVEDSITALAFRTNETLVVAMADKNIVEFDIRTQTLTPWSRLNSGKIPKQLSAQAEPACGIFVAGNTNRAWFWGPSWLATIDFTSMNPLLPRRSAKRSASDVDAELTNGAEGDEEVGDDEDGAEVVVEDVAVKQKDSLPQFWLTNKYRPLFFASSIGGDVVVSEKPQDSYQGPKALWSNRRIKI